MGGAKAGSLEVHAVQHGPLGAERPFIYNHVAKTGGSFVKNMLVGLFGLGNLTILEEWQGLDAVELPRSGPKRPFVLGATRAPCDYYTSLWSFTSGGTMDAVVRSLPSIGKYLGKDQESGYSTPEDIGRFRQWVKGLASESLNLLTARVWFSYFKKGNPCKPRFGDVCGGPKSKYESLVEEIERDLSSAALSDMADCWLRTEHLEEDLEVCLQQYEREAGIELDWQLFNELRQKVTKNRSKRRASCAEYYDEETRSLVVTKDKHVVRLFGYDDCCAEPPPDRRQEL